MIDTIFDTKELTSLLEEAESEGLIEASALETTAVELDLDDDELALLCAELEVPGVEIVAAEEHEVALGTENDEQQSLDAIADELGVSRERVRQIERHAMTELATQLEGVIETSGEELASSA
jgi:hypothetical protein